MKAFNWNLVGMEAEKSINMIRETAFPRSIVVRVPCCSSDALGRNFVDH